MLPPIHEVADDAGWERLAEATPVGLFVVYSPSVRAHVARLFPSLGEGNSWCIEREPHLEDFGRLESMPDFNPGLVMGIGGGRALDAAKAVAHWGRAYRTVAELRGLLQSGGRPGPTGRARLLLAPTIASSGSESSKGAIITVDSIKCGLRGDSLQADGVIHDARLWAGLPLPMQRHYAFDVFAHLLETTISRRRTPLASAHAVEGAGEFWSWAEGHDFTPEGYLPAMRAAYHAGVCLAASSTCLPHRIQYVLGPATGTNHVEGIWMLSAPWVKALALADPERAQEAAEILRGKRDGPGTLQGVFDLVHAQAAYGVRRERFHCTRLEVKSMAERVTGDLSADPSYADSSTIEGLLLNFVQ